MCACSRLVHQHRLGDLDLEPVERRAGRGTRAGDQRASVGEFAWSEKR